MSVNNNGIKYTNYQKRIIICIQKIKKQRQQKTMKKRIQITNDI